MNEKQENELITQIENTTEEVYKRLGLSKSSITAHDIAEYYMLEHLRMEYHLQENNRRKYK